MSLVTLGMSLATLVTLMVSLMTVVTRHVRRLSAVTPVAPPGGGKLPPGGEAPPYGWASKNYVICVCFHCHRTSSYHTTNTLQGRRAKSHVDTQTIQRTGTGGLPTLDPL